MLGNLTKEEIRKLPLETQAAVARIASDEAHLRRLLIAKAKGLLRYKIITVALLVLTSVLWLWKPNIPGLPLAFGVMLFVQFHMIGINSRLEAILTLLNPKDIEKKPNRFQ